MKKLLSLVGLLIVGLNGMATNFYVSPSGNNAANGTSPATPWQTIARVNTGFTNNTYASGDSILFQRGQSFTGTIIPTRSYTVGNPLKIAAYGVGANPIITGFVTVAAWTNLGANIWESTAAVSALNDCNMVTINGVNTAMGRSPNTGWFTVTSHTPVNVNAPFAPPFSITSSALNAAVTNWTGADVVTKTFNFSLQRAPITSASGATITYTSNYPETANNGFGFFLENDVRTLDVQNEWYYVPATKKLRIFSTTMPVNVKLATLDTLFYCINRTNIVVDGVDFTGSNRRAIFVGSCSRVVIRNCNVSYGGLYGYWGGNNFGTASQFDTIKNCTFNYINSQGIVLGSEFQNAYIGHNTLRNIGQFYGMFKVPVPNGQNSVWYRPFGGIYLNLTAGTAGAVVEYNLVDSCAFAGYWWQGSLLDIHNNEAKNCVQLTQDMGGFYSQGVRGNVVYTLSKVHDNLSHDNPGDSSGVPVSIGPKLSNGFYADENTINTQYYNNSAWNNSLYGLFSNSNTKCSFINNTLYNNGAGQAYYAATFRATRTLSTGLQGAENEYQDTAQKNIYFGLSGSTFNAQYSCRFGSKYASLDSFFILLDSNCYTRPIDETQHIYIYLNSGGINTHDNLAQWKTFANNFPFTLSKDQNAYAAPLPINNVNQVFLYYNPTDHDSTVSVVAGVDVKNNAYGGTTILHQYTSLILISTGALITPVITWANPAAITYPTPLSATQLNATTVGNIPGTFTYNPVSGTILNAGTQTLNVLFTPTNGAIYTTATKQVTIQVNQATATLSYSNLTQTYTGAQLSPTVTTNPAGLTVVNTTYNGVGTAPINAGSYAIVSGLVNQNYSAPSISGTFTINQASATISLSNLNQIYNNTPRSVMTTTNPIGLSGIAVTYNGSGTPPTNAGSYPIIATLANENYTATPASGTLVIAKATPTVTWSNPAPITYGTALSGTQLTASSSVAGTFTYTPAAGTILNTGTQTLSVNFTPTDAANYNSVNGTTVNIVVNQATATISLSNLNQVYDGLGKSATATTTPAGLGSILITYNGSVLTPVNAGSYAVVATLTNPNYTATPANGTLVISQATAVLSISNNTYTYDGTQKSVTVTTVPSGLTVISITYNGSPTAPINVNTYSVIATLSNTNYTGSVSGTLTITKATPVITWSNPAAITFGTPLSATQLNATANVAGTFTYTPPSGTILNAGNYTLVTNFTPTDAVNYNSVNGTTVNLTVNKAASTINLSNLIQDFDGNPKPVTVSTTPLGLGVLTITYNGNPTAPSAVGSYAVVVTLTNNDYQATPVNGTLLINTVSANINISNINQTYTGSPLPVTVTTIPAGLSHTTIYNGSATVPANAGTYTVIATINDGIHTGADTATFIIAKDNPVITWANPLSITYGTALSGTQLNASASVSGVFTYTPPNGTILNAGTQILSTSFSPTDVTNYNSVPVTTVSIVVNKATAVLSISNTNQAFDGNPKSVTVTTSPNGLTAISTTYNGNNAPPVAVGSYQVISNLNNSNYTAIPDTATLIISTTSAGINISNLLQVYNGSPLPVTVTTNPIGLSYSITYNASATVPTIVGTYTVIATLNDGIHTGADTQTLVIVKGTPVITWPNPANITFGTTLSGAQLNASTPVAGTFVYSPPSGTILNVGTQNLSVTFTPTDGSNYNSVIKIVPITVTGSTATLTLSNLLQTYNGTPRPVIVVTNPLGLSGVSVTYNGSLTIPANAGSYAVIASLINSNYTATPVSGTLVIGKINPVLTWVTPLPIQLSTPLSATQLNASANIPGTFTYSSPIGTVLQEGVTAVTATFHPTDSINYNNLTITVPITVYGNPLILWYILRGNGVYKNLPGQNFVFPF